MIKKQIGRREFLRTVTAGAASSILGAGLAGCGGIEFGRNMKGRSAEKPNLVYVFTDQWRAQATGYAGDPNAVTPNLDRLAKKSVNFTNAVSGHPVCSPYRASLITGQYPLTHGIFLNDATLGTDAVSIAQAYKQAGYKTAYIGKWHLDGHGRSSFIPKERRQGFEYWKVLECTHDYNESAYYGDENVKLHWDGYDAIAQTKDAQQYIKRTAKEPFALFLSWGPPHSPYHNAPDKYKDMFDEDTIKLRPNVPGDFEAEARKALAGYYAHIAALDDCVGRLLKTLKGCGLEDNTIFVFTSDHGAMLYSHGYKKKQQPFEESLCVPFLLHWPGGLGRKGRVIDMPINTPDIMPTLLGLSGVKIPETVEGTDFSAVLRRTQTPPDNAALISCLSPFGQWRRERGGKEYRGIRTSRYTYVRDMDGPWLLYDNKKDRYQLNNLCNNPQYRQLQERCQAILERKLKETNDEFLPGAEYIKKWGYVVNETGTIPYQHWNDR